jgi:hypothetical protein
LFRELDVVTMLGDEDRARCQERSSTQEPQCAVILSDGRVRRINIHEIERLGVWPVLPSELPKSIEGILGKDHGACPDSERFQIAADQCRRGRVILEKNNLASATAQGLDAHGAGTGETVEEARAGDRVTQDIEECFAQTVTCGTQGPALEAFEEAAAVGSGNDAHRISTKPSSDPGQLIAPLPLAGQPAKNALELGSLRRIVGEREGFAARQLQQFAVPQRIGDPEAEIP